MKKKRLAILAHYDKDSKVDDYVLYYIDHLNKICDKIIIVTTSSINNYEREKITNKGITLILRDNVGYDFYSWKVGIASSQLNDFDELILCNDSVYGPLWNLKFAFEKFENINVDFWGMTESYQFTRHLQSYFLVFRKKILDSKDFTNFWNNLEILDNKMEIIFKYEIGLSSFLLDKGYSFEAFFSVNMLSKFDKFCMIFLSFLPSYFGFIHIPGVTFFNLFKSPKKLWNNFHQLNATHILWQNLLKARMPFIKIELVRDNPLKTFNIRKLKSFLKNYTSYNFKLINEHMHRINKKI